MPEPARLIVILLMLCVSTFAHGQARTVQEFAHIRGQGDYLLQGIGLVAGLPGTGDSAKELAVARPLARVLEGAGNAVGLLKELERGNNVALVFISAVVRDGAKADDIADLTVSAALGAKSLKGGRLLIAPLRGPFPTSQVMALAEGAVLVEDAANASSGRVAGGLRMLEDVPSPEVADVFELILEPHYAGWASASQIAAAINGDAQPIGQRAAIAIDERTVRVMIPEAERANRAAFMSDILSARVDVASMKLPPQVVCNPRTGAIVVTGDVTIAPGAITQGNLSITTTIPAPTPTPQDPLIERNRWVGLATQPSPGDAARLDDLLSAFKRLDIPVTEQINVLRMLHRTGRLHARFIIE